MDEALKRRDFLKLGAVTGVAAATGLLSTAANAATGSQITRNARTALTNLYAAEPASKYLGSKSVAILVFPNIVKAGFLFGGETGDGALLMGSETIGYYNLSAVSFGLQAGAQTFGYALFFMNNKALKYLDKSDGWSIGSGPSVVVIDRGLAGSITSTTLTQDVYAYPFGQQGLMAGIGIEGSKITRLNIGA